MEDTATPLLAQARAIAAIDAPRASAVLRRMQAFVEMWWGQYRCTGGASMSWAGFYLESLGEPDASRLVLGPRLPKPACSPIGLHGACGQALLARRSLVVVDVADLGAGYVACDPRDRSELVVPCLNADGTAWGVFDVDSHSLGAFAASDAVACERLLAAAGLSAPHPERPRMSR